MTDSETVVVELFKPSGKWYGTDVWRVPTEVPEWSIHWRAYYARDPIGPYDMKYSPDFRTINGGPVLVPEQEPWGYPCLIMG